MNLVQIATMESLANGVDADESTTPPLSGAVSNFSDDHIEVIEALSAVAEGADADDAAGGAIDDAADAVDRITEVKEIVQDMDDKGQTIDPMTEKMVATTMECISRSLGISLDLVSLESIDYSDRASTLIATLESKIGDIFEKMVAAVKAALNNLWTFIQGLLASTKQLEEMHKKALANVEKVGKGKGNAEATMTECAKEVSVEGEATAKNIAVLAESAFELLRASDIAAKEINRINFDFKHIESGGLVAYTSGQFLSIVSDVYINGERQYADLTGDRHFTDNKYTLTTYDDPAERAQVLNEKECRDALKAAGEIIIKLKAVNSQRNYIKNAISRVSQFGVEFVMSGIPSLTKSGREKAQGMEYLRWVRGLCNKTLLRGPLESFRTAKALIHWANTSANKRGE